MSRPKNQHVVPRGPNWAVRGEGNSKDTAVAPTQRAADERATEIAKNKHSDVIVHGRDGAIRERNSYGNDPRSRKG